MALSRSNNPYGMSLRNAMDQLFTQSFIDPAMFMGMGTATTVAPMNVYETNNGYEVQVALPGVRPQDIDLTVQQNTLDIKGKFGYIGPQTSQGQQGSSNTVESRSSNQQGQSNQASSSSQSNQARSSSSTQMQQSQSGQSGQGNQSNYNTLLQEIPSGQFERTITFPRPIDANSIRTTLQDGILTVWVPISEESRPRKINVQGGQSSQSQSGQPQHVSVNQG